MSPNYLLIFLLFFLPVSDSKSVKGNSYDYLIEVNYFDKKSDKTIVRYEYWKFNDRRKSLWSNFTSDNYYRVQLLTTMLNDDLVSCCKDSIYTSNQDIPDMDESDVNPFFEEDAKYAYKLRRGKTRIKIHALEATQGCFCSVDNTRFIEGYNEKTVFFCPFKANYRKLKKQEKTFFKQHRGFFGKTMSYHFPE